ncbi:argininosuccinate lyase [Jannaschia seohaensis]|uniref:Uncharacterized protein n=1 Tax=Jannaschia seohaensis TaxID=475081 RepID=A0A2Y9BWA8_9RHOB|nr:argininosuccinate lyase [Jannaschia seohaensis]PWJ22474.1 hypothetical protein BCF38_101888 [Jannaschia seohaensis]SSA38752.1 hypothetical protein SAMN05421539_101888 [Jannaschia seohaensis]
MRKLIAALALTLAGCGVDGPPVPPSQVDEDDSRPPNGVTITGTAEFGVSGGV